MATIEKALPGGWQENFGRLRRITKAVAIKDLLDDDMVFLFALFVAQIHGWSSTVTYDGQMAELAIRLLEEAELKLEIRLLEEADRQNFPYLNTKSFP